MTLLQTETVIVWCPVWAKSRAQSRSFSHTKNAWGNCEIWSGNSLVLNRPMLSISSYGNIFCSRYLLFWKHRCSSTHIIMLLYKRMITNMTKIRCLQTSVHNDFRAFREMQRCREQRCAFLFFLPCPHPPPPTPPVIFSMKNRCKNLVNLHDFMRQNHLVMFVSLDSQSGTKQQMNIHTGKAYCLENEWLHTISGSLNVEVFEFWMIITVYCVIKLYGNSFSTLNY